MSIKNVLFVFKKYTMLVVLVLVYIFFVITTGGGKIGRASCRERV